jgi:hypothetical protein
LNYRLFLLAVGILESLDTYDTFEGLPFFRQIDISISSKYTFLEGVRPYLGIATEVF